MSDHQCLIKTSFYRVKVIGEVADVKYDVIQVGLRFSLQPGQRLSVLVAEVAVDGKPRTPGRNLRVRK